MKKIFFFVFASVFLFSIYACSPKQVSAYDDPATADKNSMVLSNNEKTLSLKDYLIRFPKLHWSNGRIMLKENASLLSQREPLYILDGIKIGNDYEKVEGLVNANDIKSVRVLTTASETSFYGLDGNNGVILIKTK